LQERRVLFEPIFKTNYILPGHCPGSVYFTGFFNNATPPEEISYDQLIQRVEQGEVTGVAMYGSEVEATLKDGTVVKTIRPDDHNLTELLLANKVTLETYLPRGRNGGRAP
jgi:ATP-dependent Zn protease